MPSQENPILSKINNKVDDSYYHQYTSMQDMIKKSLGDEQYLYKYLPLTDEDDRIKALLRDEEIWFGDPSTFNDPFECSSIVPISSKEDYERIVEDIVPDFNIETMKISDQQWHDSTEANLRHFRENTMPKYGILSLSSIWDNVLMWSHYASEHRGIVLTFKFQESHTFYKNITKVRYKPGVEFFEVGAAGAEGKIWETFSTKHTMWAYEEEYRIIELPSSTAAFDGNGLKKFPGSLLKEVIFGVRCRESNRMNVQNWIEEYQPHIEVYQAVTKIPFDIGIEKRRIK